MNYLKAVLCGITALVLAECVPGSWSMFKGISQQKATGLGAVAGGLMESAVSPLFWMLVVVFFALFFAASRIGNKALRVVLFWIPTVLISTLALAAAALIAYAFVHFRHSY